MVAQASSISMIFPWTYTLLRLPREFRPAIPTSAKLSYPPSAANRSKKSFDCGSRRAPANIFLGLSRNEGDDIHAALQGGLQPERHRGGGRGLILDVNRTARGIDCQQILLQNRSLAAG